MTAADRLPTTFDEARSMSAFALARLWGDVSAWPVRMPAEVAAAAGIAPRAVEHELQELAVMAGLADWLHRWMPIQIHRAALGGATVETIAAAAGVDVAEVRARWRHWAAGQRWLHDDQAEHGFAAGLTAAECERAASALGLRYVDGAR